MDSPSFDRRAHPPGLRFADAAGHRGWRLRAFDWPAARPSGSLLFQTGRADFAEKYIEALGHWQAAGWNVAGFDWRGQGGSAREGEGAAWSFEDMLADAAAFTARWIATTPAPHVLIGHSMGGHLLLRLLAEQSGAIRHAVAGAVLIAPMLGLAHAPLSTGAVRRIAWLACALGLGDRPIARGGVGGSGGGGGRQARLTACDARYADEGWWMAAEPSFRLASPSWRWLSAALDSIARLDAPGVLEKVDLPVLLLATDRDRLVSAAAIRRAAARMPDARLAMIDGAHELLREADPARTTAFAAIDAFLDERLTGA